MRKHRKAGAAGSHGLKVSKTLKMVTGFRGGQTKGHDPFEGLKAMPSRSSARRKDVGHHKALQSSDPITQRQQLDTR